MPKINTTKIQLSTLIGAILFCNLIFSQEYKTNKIIVDQGTKAPLGFVNINNSLDNTISNEDGQFVFISKENISSKKYKSIIFCSGILLIVVSELFNSFLEKNFYALIFALIFPLTLCFILYWIFRKKNIRKPV